MHPNPGRNRVIDLTRIYAGPYCSMLFADMGAEVIKVEPPEGELIRDNPPMVKEGEGDPWPKPQRVFLALNRNKYGITLNLKHPKAVEIFQELIKIGYCLGELCAGGDEAPGDRLSAPSGNQSPDYHVQHQRFRADRRYSERLAFDVISQAMSGLMSITGHPDNPRPVSELLWGRECCGACRLLPSWPLSITGRAA